MPVGITTIGNEGKRSSATFVVAASDSLHKERADYVCKGADDQVVIQAAIDALPIIGSRRRGTIQFLEGDFSITDTITSHGAIKFVGSGQLSGTKLETTEDITVMDITGVTGSGLESLYIEGPRSFCECPNNVPLIKVAGSDVIIRDCWIQQSCGYAILTNVAWTLRIMGCSIESYGHTIPYGDDERNGINHSAIALISEGSSIHNIKISDNVFYLGYGPAVAFKNTIDSWDKIYDIRIHDNLFDSNTDGEIVALPDCQKLRDIHIYDNHMRNWTKSGARAGIRFTGTWDWSGLSMGDLKNIFINNNRGEGECDETTKFIAIRAASCSNIHIYNNHFPDNSHFKSMEGLIVEHNTGFITENAGSSTGTGAQQTIAHGLAKTPTKVVLWNIEDGANPYQSAVADGTNINITAVINQDWGWEAEVV